MNFSLEKKLFHISQIYDEVFRLGLDAHQDFGSVMRLPTYLRKAMVRRYDEELKRRDRDTPKG